ncbi:DUF554 domain-containing protein [Desulfosediminicola sp.]|uniref:DUF554 domain-containing protein n=1 Tax=Desulfosediminicola sp. TaxID=2886825 RepID=UPI003AF292B6
MIGPYINGAALLTGSVIGAILGPRLSHNFKAHMPMTFGCAALGLGVAMIVKVQLLAPVVLALVLGSVFGELVELERAIQKLASRSKKVIEKFTTPAEGISQDEFLDKFVALAVLFCVSGTGIYGAMSEGMSGDPTLLIVKSILDFFTAIIFASSLGLTVGVLVLPQFVVQSVLFFSASLVMPLITPEMLADFSACGGMIMLATGLRISGIKQFPVVNMLPALILAMPLSWLWSTYLP